MAPPRLVGSWAKWERGKQHLDSLHDEMENLIAPLQGMGVPFQSRLETKTALTETWIFEMPQTPDLDDPRFAVIIGDILNCYRGAIDHLAWTAVKRLGSTPLRQLSEGQKRFISFPMPSRWNTFPQSFERGLPGVPLKSDFGRLVKGYQACGTGQRAAAMRALRNLVNRDKHRLLIPTFWFPSGMNFSLVPHGVALTEVEWLIDRTRRVPFRAGKPIVRATFAATVALLQPPKLELQAKATFEPALGGSWWMTNTLHGIGSTVGALLYEAAPLL